DKVLKIADATQQGDLVFNGQTDRIYTHPETYSLIKDAALKRTIEVHHHHQSDVVAWNPGAELSSSMVDMPNDGYKTMVCVETARVNKPLVAKQDSPARLAMTIRSRKNTQ
ncbi:TPA: D-hexose-6-phosphate mutarotase, partial [Yersinia enterocolitica]|nr:D-hexose-6-phosphate mutarotase [Yersinia enterocolitica]